MVQHPRLLGAVATLAGLAGLAASREGYAQLFPQCNTANSCNNPSGPAYQVENTGSRGIGFEASIGSGGVGLQGQDEAVTAPSGIGTGGSSLIGVGVAGWVSGNLSITPPTTDIGVYGYSASSTVSKGGYGVYGAVNDTAGYGYGGYFTGSGIGNPGANAALYGNATGSGGTGVLGTGNGYGVYGYTASSSGYGVFGTSPYVGVQGNSSGSSGSGVAGVNSSSGHGVYGRAVGGYGVYGTDSSTGIGVFGSSSNETGTGVYGQNTGFAGNAIYGEATNAGTGVSGNGQLGGIGVAGVCSGSGCWAGYFAGLVYINGTTYGSSDVRLKKNVTPLAGAIDQLLKLKGVTFDWREPEKHSDATGTQIGFIAQDVEKVFPNWVRTGQDGFKTLTVGQIEALEVESIRTLKAQNEALAIRMNALEANRRPLISGLTAEGTLFGFGLMTMAGAFVVTRRKRSES
jgi:hypothetical protein